MKKTKRILSMLTALAITASAFASMALPASAAETTVYTLSVPDAEGTNTVTKIASSANAATEADVADFGTGTTLTPAVAALDGWGYKHYAYDETGGRQTSAHTVKTENAFYAQGVGNGSSNNRAYISFIPANANITIDNTKTYIYEYDAYATTTGGNKTSDSLFGFTTATDGATVTDPGDSYIRIAASGVVNQAVKKKVVMVNDRAAGTYATYVDGIRQKTGTSDAITGIYATSPGAAYIKAGIGNLVVKEADAAPVAVKVTFKDSSDTVIQEYASVLSGAELTAPTPPDITGKTFVKWQKDGVDMASDEAFTAGSADTVFTAVYREGSDYSNIVVKANPYTKVEFTQTAKATDLDNASATQEAITGYTDAKGDFTASHVLRGTYSYTLTKTGYTSQTDTLELGIPDSVITKSLVLTSGDANVLYYESDFVSGAGNFGIAKTERAKDLALPDIALDEIKTISFDLDFSDTLEAQYTLMFMNDSNQDVVGIQGTLENGDIEEGLYAFTGFSGKGGASNDDYNQQNAAGKYESGVKLLDSYSGSNNISITINPNDNTIAIKTGEVTKSLELTREDFTISKIRLGKYRDQSGAVYIDNLTVSRPDPNEVIVTGDDAFAKIAGKTVTRQYKASPAVYVDGEEFTWTATDSTTGQTVTGISIDDNGLLTVEDTATVPTTLKVAVVSKTTAAKKGETTVTVNNYATLTPTIDGPKAIETGGSGTYKVTKIMDNYGDDVTEYYTPVWTIDGVNTDTAVEFTGLTPGKATAITATYDGTALDSLFAEEVTIPSTGTLSYATTAGAKVMIWDSLDGMEPVSAEVKTAPAAAAVDETTTVATVGGKSGEVTTYNDGNVTLTVTLAEGQTATYAVKVDKYYDIVDYSNQSTVSIASLVEDAAITGYLVTVSDEDSNKLAEQVTAVADAVSGAAVPAVSEGTPFEIEVAPIFTTSVGSELLIPEETYNITLNTNNGGRADVYVNDQIVVNNINQGSDNFTVSGPRPSATYKFGDIKIAEGYARFWYTDNQGSNTPVNSVVVSKAPTIVDRATRFYVIGDSLVATYYDHEGVESAKANLVRQGWGEAFKDYIKDAEVTNLGNSGATSDAMLANAFTQVRASGKAGDILVLESGYNDKSAALMKESIKQMVIEAEQKGITVFVVPPNASTHSENEYKGNVKLHASVKECVTELKSSGSNPILIDLSTNSASFFERNYGAYATVSADSTKWNNIRDTYNNSGDTLHSTNNAANAWAAVVAKGVYDNEATRKYVDTEHNFTITDANDSTHSIVVNVLTVNGTN